MVATTNGTVYCNGEFTIGALARRLQKKDLLPVNVRQSADAEWALAAVRMHGVQAALEHCEDKTPLGLSSVTISDNRSPKGLKGLTSKARRSIRCGAYRLEKRRNRHRIGFATTTLPPLTKSDYISVHKNWGAIVNRFVKWFKRRLNQACVPDHLVYVTEIQAKRHEQTKNPYLHLHLCYLACRKSDYRWYVPAHEMRVGWARAVSAFCAEQYDFNASVDAVVVKKSVARYLAKYLTKGASSIERALKDGLPVEALGHWWGWTAGLRHECRSRELRAAQLVEWLWRNIDNLRAGGAIAYVHFIYIDTPGYGRRCIGCAGGLTRTGMAVLSCIHSQIKEEAFPDGYA